MSDRPQVAYKVLTADELAALERDSRFDGSSDDRRDGFIHLSTEDQLEGTLAKHFSGQDSLQLAAVDLTSLGDSLKWEPARDGQAFPHIYGPLLLETVLAYGPLHRDDAGALRLPVAG